MAEMLGAKFGSKFCKFSGKQNCGFGRVHSLKLNNQTVCMIVRPIRAKHKHRYIPAKVFFRVAQHEMHFFALQILPKIWAKKIFECVRIFAHRLKLFWVLDNYSMSNSNCNSVKGFVNPESAKVHSMSKHVTYQI